MLNYQRYSDLDDNALLSSFLPANSVSELTAEYSTLQEALLNVTPGEIMRIRGIGPVKAKQLICLLELAKRLHVTSRELPPVIRSPQDVMKHLADMQHLPNEEFRVVYLTIKNHIIHIETISQGTVHSALIDSRLVFRRGIRLNAVGVILAHNHPSGDPQPSTEDIQLTRQLVEAGKILDITVVDHVVIGMGRFRSFNEIGGLTK